MPIRRIDQEPMRQQVCQHPEHDPPMHLYLRPGVYEHTCPGCGRRIVFTVL